MGKPAEIVLMVVLGILAGGWIGSGVAANVALPVTAPAATYDGRDAGSGSEIARPGLTPVNYDRLVAACEGCSDYQLGYRLAEQEGVAETADCEDYSWSYEAGCLAYLRRSRS